MQNWFELLCNMKHKCTVLLDVDRMIRSYDFSRDGEVVERRL